MLQVERCRWPEPDKWAAQLARRAELGLEPLYKDEAEYDVKLAKVVARLEAELRPVAPLAVQGLPSSTGKALPPPAKLLAKPVAPPVVLVKSAPGTPRQAVATPWPILPPGPHATPRQMATNRRTLHALQTAERFLAWLQATGRIGKFSSPQMTAHYRTFCDTTDNVPAAENFMRQELKRLDGVFKGSDDENDRDGKRVRPVVWDIRAEPALRRAA